jgi:hypothetical protein
LPEPGATAASPAGDLLDTDCTAPGANGFDLQHVKVSPTASGYRFGAQYSGDAFQHDIVVAFDIGSSRYIVSGELFEDGTGVGQLFDATASESTFLDPPQTIVANAVGLDVARALVGSISGSPFAITVSLKVDGADIETCA